MSPLRHEGDARRGLMLAAGIGIAWLAVHVGGIFFWQWSLGTALLAVVVIAAQAWLGVSGILCGRPLSSSDDEPLAEDDGELGLCLRPLAGWTFPLLSGGVKYEV